MTIIIFDLALENGWFEGKILYFNTQICECRILFTDRATNYVEAEDYDGIDHIVKFLLSLCILFTYSSFCHPRSFFGSMHPAWSLFLIVLNFWVV